jgi:hypothetical protein
MEIIVEGRMRLRLFIRNAMIMLLDSPGCRADSTRRNCNAHMKPYAALICSTFLATANLAEAASLSFPSLELLTVQSDHVLLCEVSQVTAKSDSVTRFFGSIVDLACEKALKGACPESLNFKLHNWDGMDPPQTGGEFLVFMQGSKLTWKIDLQDPRNIWTNPALTNDFEAPLDRDSIVAVVERRLDRMSREADPKGSLCFGMPWDSPAQSTTWSGSLNMLVVPSDPEYLDEIMGAAGSSSIDTRCWAAHSLQFYPGPRTETLLRELLQDTGIEERTTHERMSRVEKSMPVRNAAYESLTALGFYALPPEEYKPGQAGWVCYVRALRVPSR